jgi:hypothetical protein
MVWRYLLAVLVKDCTSVDKLGFPLGHGSSSRFWEEDALVVVVSKSTAEVIIKAFLVDLLQTSDVCITFP